MSHMPDSTASLTPSGIVLDVYIIVFSDYQISHFILLLPQLIDWVNQSLPTPNFFA